MSKNVTLTITGTESRALPAGKTFGGYRYVLTKTTDLLETLQAVSLESMDKSVMFQDVPTGSYTASVLAIDQDKAPLGLPVLASVVVTDNSVYYEAPLGLGVTLS